MQIFTVKLTDYDTVRIKDDCKFKKLAKKKNMMMMANCMFLFSTSFSVLGHYHLRNSGG